MINVELLKFPGRVYAYSLEDGSSIQDLLDAAVDDNPELDTDGEMRINNYAVEKGKVLRNGDRLVITKKVKGNQTNVKVTKFPGRTVDTQINHGSTIQDAIDAAEIGDVTGYQARLDGNEVARDHVIPDDGQDHRVVLTKKVKGN